EKALEQFRQEREAAGELADVVRLQSFAKEFASAKLRVAAAAGVLATGDVGAARTQAGVEAGQILVQATAPARNHAVASEGKVERVTADLVASCKAIFRRSSAMCRAAEQVSPEAHEIALVQRVILGFGSEMTALARYGALRDGSDASAQRLHEIKHRHAETMAALDDLERSEQGASDDDGKKLVDAIRERYELVTSLGSQLTNLPANFPSQSRSELEDQLESQVNSLHASMDKLATLQAADLREATDRLRATLHRTEALIAGLCGFFLLIAAGVPYMLVHKIMVPVSMLTAAIDRFKHGDLRTKVPATSNDEMGELATGFNSMTHALAENIGERRRAEEMVRDSEDKLRLLLESTAEAIYGIDLQGRCTFCNPACLRLLGYRHADDFLGKEMHGLIHHSRRDGTLLAVEECRICQALNAGSGSHVEDEVLWKADGTTFPAEYWSHPQRKGGETVGAVVAFIDITERKEAEAKIQSLAFYDTLTGLPNRVLLQDRLDKALARARRHHEKVAVLFLDLDGFKVINDSLGHSVGDVLLKHVAERLQTCAREQDTVARLGGDEFVVVLTSIKEVADVAIAAERIRKALTAEFVVLEHALHVSCSLGVSLFPDHATDGGTLVKHADAAMYRAKDSGRNNVQFFTEDMNAEVMERLVLENSLRRAQAKNELYLMYQPQVDIATGEMVGTEALIRWRHPELGLVAPDKFIPIAENSGLIVPIGEWVLRTACAQAKQWQEEGFPAVPVSVNVSAVQFRQTGFVEL
ncbi:MAG: diguanylate cyclase, partial [Terriglobales bacterium]